jgi:hypothetical protein
MKKTIGGLVGAGLIVGMGLSYKPNLDGKQGRYDVQLKDARGMTYVLKGTKDVRVNKDGTFDIYSNGYWRPSTVHTNEYKVVIVDKKPTIKHKISSFVLK